MIKANGVTFKWVAGVLLVVAGFFIGGWINRVNGYDGKIGGLEKTVAAQGAVLERMAIQVDQIRRFFPVEKGD